jgi:hypothetical protein
MGRACRIAGFTKKRWATLPKPHNYVIMYSTGRFALQHAGLPKVLLRGAPATLLGPRIERREQYLDQNVGRKPANTDRDKGRLSRDCSPASSRGGLFQRSMDWE